jgi:hypothetical protein
MDLEPRLAWNGLRCCRRPGIRVGLDRAAYHLLKLTE